MEAIKFSKANAKTEALAAVESLKNYLANRRAIYSFDLLSGWSCPFAKECLSKVVETDGKRTVKDGPDTLFRCFSASQELVYTNTFKRRQLNFQNLRGLSSMEIAKLLRDNMPKNLGICRIHVAGDMFSLPYMLAWGTMAETHPDRLFYAYTKSLPYWVKLRSYFESLPNFVLTASRGGRRDDLIDSEGLRSAKVVFSEQEAADLGLAIDHDDSHAADPSKANESFALLIHGVQPKGSEASKALVALKGKGSYSRKKNVNVA